ncbi:kelch repeat and BTB domain-containing protein 4-like [Dendronephthya gigantea]|uniref:kelch repeat and BTB domain-containing protein 4-like n=1 Tax=Dendronephthya gigantea TaxID=151771 RepID=UPI00106A059B|nr:kelch repeat and BTB domain-containing protein 4-like [Dendronephthya gigantea]XP_028396771.1 kelch repeat and BTB domain-containing protein 4-like [Dendronephthya gigantea]
MQSHSNNPEPKNPETCVDNDNVFSKPWEDSDVVLVVEGKDFHVHRSILSLQSRVFKAMFNGNFKDATQDKIELKEDTNQKAMLQFLKLLYPSNMLDEVKGSVSITDENVFEILQLADKYGAINIIKQCMKEAGRLKPENTMRLLPYAERNKMPLEKIYDAIIRHVSTTKLTSFASEIGNEFDKESVYIDALIKKCCFYEDVAERANTMIHHLLQKCVSYNAKNLSIFGPVNCARHGALDLDFRRARNCKNCLDVYKRFFIDQFARPNLSGCPTSTTESLSVDFLDLLQITDDIANSLKN